jgi:ATP-binding cassette subfamily F protein 3
MIAVGLDRVSFTYFAKPVFTGLSWEVHDDRCVGLIGPNGSGKSTLLRLIAGELTGDAGTVARRRGLTIDYLPQEICLEPGHTVWQVAISASTDLLQVQDALVQVEQQLADPAIYGDEQVLARVLDQHARLLERYEELGGSGYESRVRATLGSLGFADADVDLPVEALSGGQKKLAGLARLLLTQPDLLLLDEPDNHLDLAGKAFLERLLSSYPGGVVIVSHDRYLLDLVVDEIVELEDGRLSRYPGTYSEYAFEKQMRLQRQQQLYQAQQKEVKRLEQAAKRLLTWGKVYDNPKFSRRGMNILKRLERMDRLDRPVLERKRMRLELRGWRGSNKVLEIIGLDKAFPPVRPGGEEKIVLAGLDLLIWHGERVGMVGPNGSGKSLLFRLILGQEVPSGGQIKLGPSVRIGYYAQEHETLDYALTPIETVRRVASMTEGDAVRFLTRFLFRYEQVRAPVANLSGGERSRLQLALLMLSGANFLLLDEPTNNLDIASAEVLEDALDEFEGTVLVISHDRYLLDRVVGRIVELDQGRLTSYPGNYGDYQEARAGRRLPAVVQDDDRA